MKMKQAENIYLSKFSEWLIIQGRSSKTAQSFCGNIKRFLEWLEKENIEAENTSYRDLLAYVKYLKNKNNKQRTQQVTVNAIKHFYNFLQSEETVTENPANIILIKGIKRKTLHEILTPEELGTLYRNYNTEIKREPGKRMPPQKNNALARVRNKIILGLIIYQGLRTEELARIEIQDLKLREGKIFITGSRRTEERTMKLESHQVYDLLEYTNTTRKQILTATKKNSSKVFISVGTSLNFQNIMQKLMQSVRGINPKIKDLNQIRTSVITNWLKVHNLRKVQYMAGHRYVSSTEAYQQNNIEELQEDIKKYHPIG